MAYWICRSEPDVYGWDDLVADKETLWDGVRNYAARNFLKQMRPGDEIIFYHSNKGKEAVGIMAVTGDWQPDGEDGKWAKVPVKPVRKLARPITLDEIKRDKLLGKMEMVRQSRLSVTPVKPKEWERLLELAAS